MLSGSVAHAEPRVDVDAHHLHRALSALSSGDGGLAMRHAEMISNPAAAEYVRWRLLLDQEVDHSIGDYADFIERHPYWPRLDRIQVRMEESMSLDGNEKAAQRVLDTRGPLLGDGTVALAVVWEKAGRADKARDMIRHLWRTGVVRDSLEDIILSRFGDDLRTEDHEARLDFLLWERHLSAARRMLRLVPDGYRRLAEARMKLQLMDAGVDAAINRVPRQYRDDPGLTFDRLRWRRRKGRDNDARAMLMHPPADLVRPEVWWTERSYQIRELMAEKRYDSAFRLARLHGQTDGLPFAEAEWLAGWLALRFAGKPQEALTRFSNLAAKVSTPISSSRAAYWAGRAAFATGDKAAAKDWYGRAAVFATTFYGQEAAIELGREQPLINIGTQAADHPPTSDIRELLEIGRMLCHADAPLYALAFWQKILELQPDDPIIALREAASCGRPDLTIRLGKRAVRSDLLDPIATYPVVQVPTLLDPPRNGPPSALMLAIARQESHFNTDALSVAGAMGLMQLMPSTARHVARINNLPFVPARLTTDPDYNALLAAHFLKGLLRQYGNSNEMVAAAYNAGPNRVRRWVEEFGDPRGMSEHDRIDWIEKIPFSETRNYVQRVVEGFRVYHRLLKEGGGWKISPVVDRGPMVPPPVPGAKPGDS
ncbi:MAG: lytic transglycosylase domain-containing protein [Geminicoccaceae bacterium]|nr:lytic transglycosylase domain-containing protein [Geminicoccaceae bacterium]